MINEDFIEFVKLVYKMRKQQKQYFKTREPSDLKASKAFEKEVDERVKKILTEHLDSMQTSIFDGLTEFIQMGGGESGKIIHITL